MHGARLSLAAGSCAGLAGLATPALAQKPATLSDGLRRFVAVDAPRVVLTHVRVIDGKGNPAVEDRNVVLEDGRILSLGIDNLEHGFFVNTQLDPDKKPDACSKEQGGPTLKAMDPESEAARQLIAKLVARHVAITSTLPVFEHRVPNRPPLRTEALEALRSQARESFLVSRSRRAANSPETPLSGFKRAMALDRSFTAAGGLLRARTAFAAVRSSWP